MKSYQIMCFIGNGFDINVLNKYGKGITTSYESFYHFFGYKYPARKDNLLIQQMKEAKKEGKKNWSDFEALLNEILQNIVESDKLKIEQLNKDLNEIQRAFSEFLNDIIDDDVIGKISYASEILRTKDDAITKENYTIYSLSHFLSDLSDEQYNKMHFHNGIDNGDSLKYIFLNLNYTALLDNYLYLDKKIFDPEPYIYSENNFKFMSNPNLLKNHQGYPDPLLKLEPIEVLHPHGYQDIPKSLLFGIESETYNKPRDKRKVFVKSIWAQSKKRYESLFKTTSLFIIYGCSLGESDSWWWKRIFDRLIDDDPAELIIYHYGNETADVIKDRFISSCQLENVSDLMCKKGKENIYIINFGSNNLKNVVYLDLPELSSAKG